MTDANYKPMDPNADARPPLERGLLVDQVAERIRSDILEGRLQPGQRIPVSSLSEELGVSPIPVREALRRLESEALVQTAPHQVPTVADIGIAELGEIYALRRLIECDTARLAVAAATQAQKEMVAGALERLLSEDPEVPQSQWWEAHAHFHESVLSGGLDPWRTRILSLLWQASQRYQRLYTLVFGQDDGTPGHVEGHMEIGAAFAAGDAARLENAIASHLNRTESVVREGYQRRSK